MVRFPYLPKSSICLESASASGAGMYQWLLGVAWQHMLDAIKLMMRACRVPILPDMWSMRLAGQQVLPLRILCIKSCSLPLDLCLSTAHILGSGCCWDVVQNA